MRFPVPDERERAILGFIRAGTHVVDVGCDRAFIPLEVVRQAVTLRSLSVTACDISEKALSLAQESFLKRGISTVRFVRCDGLAALGAFANTDIVIAGMGGETIAAILAGAGGKFSPDTRLILQPMSRREKLLDFLERNCFAVIEKKTVAVRRRDYHVYHIKQF